MTTFLYTTDSTGGKLADAAAVKELCESYEFPNELEPTIDNRIRFAATDAYSSFDVSKPSEEWWCTEEFLADLQPYLETKLEITCVQTRGEGEPAAYKWIVGPTTDPELVSL